MRRDQQRSLRRSNREKGGTPECWGREGAAVWTLQERVTVGSIVQAQTLVSERGTVHNHIRATDINQGCPGQAGVYGA